MNWKPTNAEFLGTIFLVFFGVSGFVEMSANDMIFEGAITLALTLFVLVHIFGPVSGCHLNPVITIPVFLSGKMKQDETIAYIIAQILGATLGFMLFKEFKPETNPTDIGILIFALIGTTFFVTSLLTSQDPGSIGATLFIVLITSFGEVNPGVALGDMISSAIDGNAEWAFFGVIGSFLGCILGWQIKEKVVDS